MTDKSEIRQKMLLSRDSLNIETREKAVRAFTRNALLLPELRFARAAALYFPVKSEMDVLPLGKALRESGVKTLLPVVEQKDAPLVFKEFSDAFALEKGAFGIPVPPANAPVARPDVIIAPLSAFDRKGGRTGYGGGFYDRTLAAFETKPFYVGAAFGAQECDEIPCEKTDFTLDCIVTEKEIIRIRS